MRRLVLALPLLLPPAAVGAEIPPLLEARCGSCHAFVAGAPPRPGPNLAGIAGRRLAGDRDFDYSPALRAAAAGDRVWDGATLDAFLGDPDRIAPGSWMSPVVFESDAERQRIIEALLMLAPTR